MPRTILPCYGCALRRALEPNAAAASPLPPIPRNFRGKTGVYLNEDATYAGFVPSDNEWR